MGENPDIPPAVTESTSFSRNGWRRTRNISGIVFFSSLPITYVFLRWYAVPQISTGPKQLISEIYPLLGISAFAVLVIIVSAIFALISTIVVATKKDRT
jgi:hypothetical protein